MVSAGISILFTACSQNIQIEKTVNTLPNIVPDYTEVTIPCNIAPLHFSIPDSCQATRLQAIFQSGNLEIRIKGKKGQIAPSFKEWKKLLAASDTLSIRLQVEENSLWKEYTPFHIYIKQEQIDSHLAYRLIEPGYEIWNEMGIYQ